VPQRLINKLSTVEVFLGVDGSRNILELKLRSANFAEIPKKIQPWGFSHVNIYMDDTTDSTQFTIADLAGIRNIIDLACQRGAFRGEEMKDVGLTFERLTNFIVQAQQAADAQAQAPDAEQEPAEPATPTQGE
jgi:hypothetical protein